MLQHLDAHTKGALDAAAGVTVLGSILGYLPGIAAGFAIAWYCMLMISWIANKGWRKK